MARAPSTAAVLFSVHAVVPGTDGIVFDTVRADRRAAWRSSPGAGLVAAGPIAREG
ncbi:hypothetical protein ACFYY2_15675 [Streptomyces sp. NPDC001822]|uniref:hypothetical protein n=1 Tax=Streptomyces sp. NPDC001822 TaxID=3364614 RepID=UPI00368F9207